MTYAAKPLMAILRRAVHSGYKTLLMNNRMLMQCYDLNIDSDIGLHYILHIPDDVEGDFYDMTLVLKPSEIMSTYREGHLMLEDERKYRKLKTKEATEEFHVKENDDGSVTLKFTFLLQDELITTKSVIVPGINDYNRTMVDNIQESLLRLMDKIKPGGFCLFYDGLRGGLDTKVYESEMIYEFIAKPYGKPIRVPITKNMFLGMKGVDTFEFTLQESVMDHVYILAIRIGKGDIEENLWGYVLNYR